MIYPDIVVLPNCEPGCIEILYRVGTDHINALDAGAIASSTAKINDRIEAAQGGYAHGVLIRGGRETEPYVVVRRTTAGAGRS